MTNILVNSLIKKFESLPNHQSMAPYKKLMLIAKEIELLENNISLFNSKYETETFKIYFEIHENSFRAVFKNFSIFYSNKDNFQLTQCKIDTLNLFSQFFNAVYDFVCENKVLLHNIEQNSFNYRSIESAYLSVLNKQEDQKNAGIRKYLKQLMLDFKNNYTFSPEQPFVNIELRFDSQKKQFLFKVHTIQTQSEIEKYKHNPSNVLINYDDNVKDISLTIIQQLIPFIEKLPMKQRDLCFYIDKIELDNFIHMQKNMQHF